MSSAPTRHVEPERLSAWLAGDLSERETAVVRLHVEDCEACRGITAELRTQVVATRSLEHPEPPPTLWAAIEGALDQAPPRRRWSWPATLTGALAGAAAVVAVSWGGAQLRGRGMLPGEGVTSANDRRGGDGTAHAGAPREPLDPLLAEAERELQSAARSYEQAVDRLRKILDREQVRWDPEQRARVSDRLARLDEAVAHSRAVAGRDPGDGAGADMLFSAYQRQIDFLAEVVHRGSPAAPDDQLEDEPTLKGLR